MKAKDKRIIVLPQGWVLIGDYIEEEGTCYLHDAAVIRTWGTTNGLGEIALSGPTKATVLDPCGEVSFPAAQKVFDIRCVFNK